VDGNRDHPLWLIVQKLVAKIWGGKRRTEESKTKKRVHRGEKQDNWNRGTSEGGKMLLPSRSSKSAPEEQCTMAYFFISSRWTLMGRREAM